MKHRYITPEIELPQMQPEFCILQDSLVDNYGGDNVNPIDGEW